MLKFSFMALVLISLTSSTMAFAEANSGTQKFTPKKITDCSKAFYKWQDNYKPAQGKIFNNYKNECSNINEETLQSIYSTTEKNESTFVSRVQSAMLDKELIDLSQVTSLTSEMKEKEKSGKLEKNPSGTGYRYKNEQMDDVSQSLNNSYNDNSKSIDSRDNDVSQTVNNPYNDNFKSINNKDNDVSGTGSNPYNDNSKSVNNRDKDVFKDNGQQVSSCSIDGCLRK